MSGILSAFIGRVAGVVTDAYFNLVTLLLPGNGTNGAQNNTFLDSSSNNFTITRNGGNPGMTQGTFSPFSQTGWSNYFDGSGDFLSWNSGSSVAFGTSDFTVEAFVYVTSTPNIKYIIDARDSSNTGAWAFAFGLGGTGYKLGFFDGTTTIEEATASIPNNSWQHCVAVRSGTRLSVYLNGSRVATDSNNTKNLNVSPTTSYIGTRYTGSGYDLEGYISNVRIIKGTAAYDPTQTTITVPTAPLTDVANTVLLTCASNRFFDKNTQATAKTITVNGTPSVQAFSPFAPTAAYSAATVGGSGYFDGTGDYLNVASNTALTFGTGDFTVEGWFYANALGGQPAILNNGSDAAGLVITMVSSKIYAYFVGAGNVFGSSGATIVTNTWYHFAWVRSGSTHTFYLNGAVYGATYSSAGNHSSTGGVGIGYSVAGTAFAAWNGYIANVRMVKGTAVYTGAFTPPIAPVTTSGPASSYSSTTNVNTTFTSTNTSLLLNFTNAGITDATAKNVLETVGGAQISTTQSKFGGSSMYFDGTGDWLTVIDNPNLQMGSGDFTIEGWFYLSATGVAYGIASKGTSTTGWSVNITSGNKLQFSYTSSNLTGATTLSSATWYYFAVVRSGTATGNLKVYLNGSADATSAGAVTDNFNQTNIMYIGADRVGGSALNGYIDDLRITKGFARTIATPSSAFPLQ